LLYDFLDIWSQPASGVNQQLQSKRIIEPTCVAQVLRLVFGWLYA